MDKLDEGLKTLLDLGKRRGFLTFDQVNDYLPDEASSPEKIHGLLVLRLLGEVLVGLVVHIAGGQESALRLILINQLDAHLVEHFEQAMDALGAGRLVRQEIVDLVEGEKPSPFA